MNPVLRLEFSVAMLASSLALVAGAQLVGCDDPKFPPPPPLTSAAPRPEPAPVPTPKLPTEPPKSPSVSAVRISEDILRACGIKNSDAYFAFDSANLRSDDTGALAQVTTCFASGPLKGRILRIVGHTDPRGSSEYNMTLGQSRADAVTRFVTGRGLNPAQVQSSTRGEMDASGDDEPGWAKDRRVDLLLAPRDAH